jgi:hypothetical protein
MPQELLWRTAKPGIRVLSRAPSWSWASTDGSRVYNDYGLHFRNRNVDLAAILLREPGESDLTCTKRVGEDIELYTIKISAQTVSGDLVCESTAGKNLKWSFRALTTGWAFRLYGDDDLSCLPGGVSFVTCGQQDTPRRL